MKKVGKKKQKSTEKNSEEISKPKNIRKILQRKNLLKKKFIRNFLNEHKKCLKNKKKLKNSWGFLIKRK